MKPLLKYTLIAIAVIIVPISLFRSCQLDDAYKALRTTYNELKKTADDERVILTEAITVKIGEIARMNKVIEAANVKATQIQGQIKDKDKSLTKLEREYAELVLLPAQKDVQIENLEMQIKIWSEKFTLAQNIISEKDTAIASWESKFNAQVGISDAYKRQLATEVQLRSIQDKRVSYLETRLKLSQFIGTVKTIAIIGIGGYMTYSLLRK